MTSALGKVETPLMERYETKCVSCGWYRHFFGTAKEARESALLMGWEFREKYKTINGGSMLCGPQTGLVEEAYCPHCRLLVKKES